MTTWSRRCRRSWTAWCESGSTARPRPRCQPGQAERAVDTSIIRDKEQEVRPSRSTDHFFDLLAYYRELVLARICELVPRNRYQRTLYGPMLEYPLREGKGFRPALCL